MRHIHGSKASEVQVMPPLPAHASSLFLVGASVGDIDALKKAAQLSGEAHGNVALWSNLILGDIDASLSLLTKAGRHAEACLLARTYAPEKVHAHFECWRDELSKVNKQLALALKEPAKRVQRIRDDPERQVSVPAPEQLTPEPTPPELVE